MPQRDPKPSITILYDAQEELVRNEELADGKKVPALVCNQIEAVLTQRGYTVKQLAAEAPIKRLAHKLEDDASDLVFNICESLGGAGTEARWENEFKEAREFVPNDIVSNDE